MNPLKRRALGTKNKPLKHNPDGGPTIQRGNKSPGKEKKTGWLRVGSFCRHEWLDYWRQLDHLRAHAVRDFVGGENSPAFLALGSRIKQVPQGTTEPCIHSTRA